MKKLHAHLPAVSDFVRRRETEIRYVINGVINTVLGIGLFPMLYLVLTPLGLHYFPILVFSGIVCVGFAFLTNKFLVFRTSGNVLKELSRFLMFHSANFLLSIAAVPAIVEFFGISPIVAQPFFVVAIAASSYFWHRHITFKPVDVAVPYPLPSNEIR